MDQYAVFGNPIEHSKSPDIHHAFAKQLGEEIDYRRQLLDENAFAEQAAGYLASLQGANVTVPFKQDAYEFVDSLSKRARQAGAVNTLVRESDGTWRGDNTDGIGMVTDIIRNQGWQVAGKRVLVLGAGGAVRGVLGPLLEQQPAEVVLVNRTHDKAVSLAQAFAREGKIVACQGNELTGTFDLIINGTSASLAGQAIELPAAILCEQTACYDMMYSQQLTPFLQWAKTCGVTALADGLGMLVEQAAEAYALWRGKRPDTTLVIAALRQ